MPKYVLPFMALLAVSAGLSQGVGATVGADHLVVSIRENTALSDAPRYIAEYATDGTRIRIFSHVPDNRNDAFSNSVYPRDLVVGLDNAIYVYFGTFNARMARFDLENETWDLSSFSGWSTESSNSFGGLAIMGHYIFATDMRTAPPGSPQGIIRFDIAGGSPVRFAQTISPNDLTLGLDGLLYALDGTGSPRDRVHRFDPITGEDLGAVKITFHNHRAVAVAGDGSIYTADNDGVIRRFSPAGTLLDSLTVEGSSFSDIDIRIDGRIALGTAGNGDVVLTDLELDSYTKFNVTGSPSGGYVFVTWAPVPEPSAFLLTITGTVIAAGGFRRRGRRQGPKAARQRKDGV